MPEGLRNGYVPPVVSPGGGTPSLDLYAVHVSAATLIRIELLDSGGRTVGQGTVNLPAGPSVLRTVVALASAPLGAAFAVADGALIRPAGNVRFNTSGSASGDLAPSADSLAEWKAGVVYLIGWASGSI